MVDRVEKITAFYVATQACLIKGIDCAHLRQTQASWIVSYLAGSHLNFPQLKIPLV
jgi:hypothetical protein